MSTYSFVVERGKKRGKASLFIAREDSVSLSLSLSRKNNSLLFFAIAVTFFFPFSLENRRKKVDPTRPASIMQSRAEHIRQGFPYPFSLFFFFLFFGRLLRFGFLFVLTQQQLEPLHSSFCRFSDQAVVPFIRPRLSRLGAA